MLCDGPGEWRFIVLCVRKANAEGFNRAAALRLHQCDDCGRIDATGEERADRNVRHHLHCDGLIEQLVQSIRGGRGISLKRIGQAAFYCRPQGPILLNYGGLPSFEVSRIELEDAAGSKFENVFIYAMRRWDVAIPHITR